MSVLVEENMLLAVNITGSDTWFDLLQDYTSMKIVFEILLVARICFLVQKTV